MTISISNSWHCALTCSVQRIIRCVRNYEELIKVIFLLKKILFLDFPVITEKTTQHTDYRRPEKKQSSLHGQKFTPTPTFSDMAEAYFVCHVSPIFQISLIYAFIECLQSVCKFLGSFVGLILRSLQLHFESFQNFSKKKPQILICPA